MDHTLKEKGNHFLSNQVDFWILSSPCFFPQRSTFVFAFSIYISSALSGLECANDSLVPFYTNSVRNLLKTVVRTGWPPGIVGSSQLSSAWQSLRRHYACLCFAFRRFWLCHYRARKILIWKLLVQNIENLWNFYSSRSEWHVVWVIIDVIDMRDWFFCVPDCALTGYFGFDRPVTSNRLNILANLFTFRLRLDLIFSAVT